MKLSIRTKRVVKVILVSFLLTLIPVTAFADSNDLQGKSVSFEKITGYIQEIEKTNETESLLLKMEDLDGNHFGLHIPETAINMTGDTPKKDDFLLAYYDTRKPMVTIYPPEYKADVFMVASDQRSLFVGEFDERLIDTTNYLRLNIGEKTRIVDRNGGSYAGPLEGKELAILYGAATKSIPAQTSPELIVLLEGETNASETELYQPDVASMDLMVEGELTPSPEAWLTEDDVVMVPLRAIAEKIGANVMWSEELQTVMLGDSFTLTIGEDAYYNMKYDDPISLGQASEIRHGRTFVPLAFFRNVIPMNNAYVFENQIVINNDEPME